MASKNTIYITCKKIRTILISDKKVSEKKKPSEIFTVQYKIFKQRQSS